jgi:hypothetical protein
LSWASNIPGVAEQVIAELKVADWMYLKSDTSDYTIAGNLNSVREEESKKELPADVLHGLTRSQIVARWIKKIGCRLPGMPTSGAISLRCSEKPTQGTLSW